MIKTTRGYQNHIAKSLRNEGWDFGKVMNVDSGWKIPLINKGKGSFLLAVHTGSDNARWNLYGSLQDIREWEIAVNKLTDDFTIRDFVEHIAVVDGDDSMRKDTPQEVALNILWWAKTIRNK